MDYTAVCRTGAQTLHTALGPVWNFIWEKSCIFLRRKITYFSVWKNQGFLLAVLYWTVDSGQKDCPVVGNGTLDSGQWTGQSGQNLLSTSLLPCLSLIVLKWTDRMKNSSIKSIGYNGSVQPCRGFGIKSAGYANGWTELRKTHIYIYIIYLYIFPLLLTPLYYIYIFFTVQIK